MKDNSKLAVGLDIGTNTTRVVIGLKTEEQISIIGLGEVETNGMRKGVVADTNAVADSICRALVQAEQASGQNVDSAVVNIDGMSILSTDVNGMIAISGEIIQDDIIRLENLSTIGKIPNNRIILGVVPYEYVLDSQTGIKDPIGMTGSRLELKANVISTLKPHYDSLQDVVAKEKITSRFLVSAVAAAQAVLNEKQKENGVMLIDLGAATTGIAIYEGGDLRYTTVLSVGGNTVTNDLATGLQIVPELAELVKTTHGTAIFDDDNKQVSVKFDKQSYDFNQAEIDEIVSSRLNEIFILIKRKLKESGYLGKLPNGVVLTGGGAKLKGIDNYCQNALNMVTNIARPQYNFTGLDDKIRGVEFATVVGLMLQHAQSEPQIISQAGLLDKLKNFLKK